MPMKSLVNAAYDVLKAKYAEEKSQFAPVPFANLLQEVGAEVGIDDEEELIKIASRFYTDLTLDGRFVIKENNTWVLRENEKFENVHIDMNEVYSLDEYEEEEETDKKSSDEDTDDEDSGNRVADEEKEDELGEETENDLASNADEEYEENN